MANKFIVHPEGALEDVLVEVNKLIFPANFYVIKMEENNTPGSSDLLLGRPFLSTASTKIDIRSGTLTMEFDGEIVKFNVYDAISHPSKILSVNRVDIIDSLVYETFESIYEDKSKFIFDDYESVNELLSLSNTKLLPSVVQAPYLELKSLPEHLKYAFLGTAFKYLITKKEAKPRLIRWILLLQEFDIEIRDKKECENLVADYLSRLKITDDDTPINDEFPDESLFSIEAHYPWYADIVNLLTTGSLPAELAHSLKDKLRREARYYIWDDPYLWKHCSDQIIRRRVPEIKKMETPINVVQDMDLCAVIFKVNMADSNPREWWLDTGATCHMCCAKDSFLSWNLVKIGRSSIWAMLQLPRSRGRVLWS
ncbi:uncharacterized protein LOC128286784 [Gossypium arboreum]|uniref:uncharacterized protein LOC128286784 n=1 Tax=Gossypium arboreum TaxID=29729 RepID=UPI0022F17BDC|nr:uncharacterized protein LOC128286784 [Gossypium arboreum]